MKKVYFILGALIATTSFGQMKQSEGKYSPNGITTVSPRNNASFGQKASYYSESFDTGFGEWKAATQSGGVGFELTNSGHLNNAGSSFYIPALVTSTPTQWVVLDSDAYGTSGTIEKGTLTSGRIDLTSAAGGPLKISFEQFMAEWTTPVDDSCFVGISTDSTNWKEYAINDGVGRDGRPNPETVLVNISNDYIANPDSVWIRFRWYGQFNYGWQIDNVRIEDLPNNDLSVNKVFSADITTTYEYTQIPQSQTTPMKVGAIVKNQGLSDQTNISLTATITGSTSGQVAQNSITIPSLVSFTQDTFWVDLAYTPSTIETFTVRFDVPADDNIANDFSESNMEVTQNYYSHYEPSNTKVGFSDTSETVAIGTVFTIENDVNLYQIQAQFAEGTNVAAEFYVVVQQINTGIQDVSQLIAETPFYVDPADTALSAGWVSINLVEAAPLYAGNAYIIELQTLDAGLEPLNVKANRNGNADLSTTVYGPYGTGNAINRYYGWGWVPAIRMNLDPSLSIEENTIEMSLAQNMPNPFNNSTTITYSVTSTNEVSIEIVDMTGKVIMNINDGVRTPGTYSVNISGQELASGMYFYTISDGSSSLTKTMTVAK